MALGVYVCVCVPCGLQEKHGKQSTTPFKWKIHQKLIDFSLEILIKGNGEIKFGLQKFELHAKFKAQIPHLKSCLPPDSQALSFKQTYTAWGYNWFFDLYKSPLTHYFWLNARK